MNDRVVVLDTETTGLYAKDGERIIEIGCVELVQRQATGRTFHEYLNPQGRVSSPEALAVHGISAEFLADKPTFAHIVDDLRVFLRGAELVIHNATFDMSFLNAEFARLNLPPVIQDTGCTVVDTLGMAKRQFPGKKNSLDGLCSRFGINNTHRTLHGALLDARLLADVYIAMTRGQDTLGMELDSATTPVFDASMGAYSTVPFILEAGDIDAGQAYQANMDSAATKGKGGAAIWRFA